MAKTIDSYALIKLGLSPNEAKCYLVLLQNEALTVAQIADKLTTIPNAVYRLLTKLESFGMVVSLGTSPKKYQAVPVKSAVGAYVRHQKGELEKAQLAAIAALGSTAPPHTSIDVITGQNQYFDRFIQQAKKAKHEILLISIGEPVTDEIKLATRDALAKGVTCKFMFHRYDQDNRQLLQAWAAMGVEVAHYPDAGFHLVITDGETAILVASNPKEPAERTGMVITSPNLANALRNFFISRWEQALPIKP